MRSARARGVWGQAPRKIWIFDLLRSFLVSAKPSRRVSHEARRNKGMTLLQAAEAAKQLIIRVRRGEISALILIPYRHP